MAAMTSIVCVQPGLTCSTRIMSSATPGTRTARTASASLRRAPTQCCSEFDGCGVHASSSSVVFNLERSLAKRQAIVPERRRGRGQNLVVRGLFGLGVPELAVIAGVAAILFGPKKLPEIGKSLGKTVKSFQQTAKEFESEVKFPNAGVSDDYHVGLKLSQAAKEFETEVKNPSAGAVGPAATESTKTEVPVTPTAVSKTPTTASTASDKDSA